MRGNPDRRRELGTLLTQMLAERGWTITQAAAACGVSTQTVTALRDGEPVRDLSAHKIERGLGLRPGAIGAFAEGEAATLEPSAAPPPAAGRLPPTVAVNWNHPDPVIRSYVREAWAMDCLPEDTRAGIVTDIVDAAARASERRASLA